MTSYSEFRLSIDRQPSAGSYRVVATSPSGEALGRFKLPFSDIELENFVLKIGRTRRGERGFESPEMELAKAFGGRLFSSLFDGDVKELFRSSLADARTENRGLRITLSLTGAAELGQIPWEYLYDDPNFMSISRWTPIVRSLELPTASRPLQHRLAAADHRGRFGTVRRGADRLRRAKAKLGQALAPLVQSGAVGHRLARDADPVSPPTASCARPTITSSTTSGTVPTTTMRTTAFSSWKTISAVPGGSPASNWEQSCRAKPRSG